MRHFAIIGSGPAGFYTAEALQKAYGDGARIDILDRFPVPYGLIRFGVAPDHQSLKAVSKRYDKVVDDGGVDFIGNVTIGSDVSIAEFAQLIRATVGFEGRIAFDTSRPDGTPRKVMDVSALNALGWTAPTSLDLGLRRYYRWFLANVADIRQ